MKASHLNIIIIAAIISVSLSVYSYAQDEAKDAAVPVVEAQDQSVPAAPATSVSAPALIEEVPAMSPAPDASTQAKEVAIYGEVQAVNSAASTLSVQYYDYDTDSEKTAEIIAGAQTKIENVSALADIKKGDWVDVTYMPQDGRNEAKIVTVEKEESPEPEEAAEEPSAPEASLPMEQ